MSSTGTEQVNSAARTQATETSPCTAKAPCSPASGLMVANTLISPAAKSFGWPVSSTLLMIGLV